MAIQLTAEDLVPLVAALTPEERTRLLRLIVRPQADDDSLYRAMPPRKEEFSSDEDQLSWEGEGWDNLA
ncbi:MAG: hypothetical protein KF812_13840 [Fimbriimonadaceae bacterium]|nr:hypothetical protein [Fimbriimonadaceae bacterium]